MTSPLVSVVIPGYNCARHVAATLDSALAQDYANFEIVFVDDGSTDDTAEVLAAYRDRVAYRRTKNGGLASARNAGMEVARGEYIAWLDADDICEPDRLKIQVALLERVPELVASSTSFSCFDDERGVFAMSHGLRYYSQLRNLGFAGVFAESTEFEVDGRVLKAYFGEVWKRLLLGNFMHPPTMMFRRAARERAGWLRNGIRYAEDWDYILRLAELGKVALIDAPLLRYRMHPGQMSIDANSAPSAQSSLRVLTMQVEEHPERVADMADEIKASSAAFHASVAYALAEKKRLEALGHLLQAVKLDHKQAHFARNLARIMVGQAGLGLLRSLRS